MRFEKKNTDVIDDPVRHAESVHHKKFRAVQRVIPWEPFLNVCVTSQFSSLGKGYERHCGPVAITNLILALHNRFPDADRGKLERVDVESPESIIRGNPESIYRGNSESINRGNPDFGQKQQDSGRPLQPEEVFLHVSGIGEKMLIYHNMDLFHHFGGTSDALTGLYICTCLKKYHLECSVLPFIPFRRGLFMERAKQDRILYLVLRHHPCYGNHHVICCGAVEVESEDRQEHALYLAIADGWAPHLRYLPVSELGICFGYQIVPGEDRG